MTMIKIDQYFDSAAWQKFTKAAEGRETPFLVVDLSRIKAKYHEMVSLFPKAKIHYAMKASPAVEVIELLAELGQTLTVLPSMSWTACLIAALSHHASRMATPSKKPSTSNTLLIKASSYMLLTQKRI